MRLTFKFSIDFTRTAAETPDEHHPAGDNFTSTELADHANEPELQTGFQRHIPD